MCADKFLVKSDITGWSQLNQRKPPAARILAATGNEIAYGIGVHSSYNLMM